MSKNDDSAIRLGTLNISGGYQVVCVGDSGKDRAIQELLRGLSLLKPLWDNFGALLSTGQVDQGDECCVDGGTVVQLKLTYTTNIPDPKQG